jgi:hypothetical protein
LNLSNPNPPFFHITDRGCRTLESLSRDPGNPSGYLRTHRIDGEDQSRGSVSAEFDAPDSRHKVGSAKLCLILKSGTQPARSQSEPINIYPGLPLLGADGP